MPEIIIVPTSHIAEQSIRAVERVIREERPGCVAVELDLDRLMAMEGGEASPWLVLRELGPATFLMFFFIKRVQGWLGRKVGVFPGSEMLRAVRTAEREGIHVEFIDQDLALTLDRLRRVSRREKARLVLFMLKGLTLDSLLARAGKARLDLRKVPPRRLIDQVMAVLRREFPGFHRALVTERDIYMARRLMALSARFEKVVAVVGAAHSPGIQGILRGARGG